MTILEWAASVKATPASAAVRAFGNEARDIIESFLSGDITETAARNAFTNLIADNWISVARQAWADGGGYFKDFDNGRLSGQVKSQAGFARDLFERLAGQRAAAIKNDTNPLDYSDNAVELWRNSLVGQYNTWKVASVSGKPELLQWVLGATEKHCGTCSELAGGPPHTAIWFENRGYMPSMPGSATECGGYHCDCSFVDIDGNDFTLSLDE